MKITTAAVAIYSLLSYASAHNTMGYLLVNGIESKAWKYVMDVASKDDVASKQNDQFGKTFPQMDMFSKNITCGRNAFDSLQKTEVADVIAGDKLGFRTLYKNEIGGQADYFFHPGPAQLWLSQAPKGGLKSYKGDGEELEWFKIGYAGPKNDQEWLLMGRNTKLRDYNFTLPKATPPGEYFARWEYIFPTSRHNYTQWYINCALINVHGPGGGTLPTQLVKFPGAYQIEDIGLWVPYSQDMEIMPREQLKLTDYKAPGPAVWTG